MIIKRRYKLSPYAKEAVFYFRFGGVRKVYHVSELQAAHVPCFPQKG